MRIIIVRHGQSKGNVDLSEYARVGDAHVSLTDTGWAQALRSGVFLNKFYQETDTQHWPRVWTSSFRRTQETTRGILTGIGDNVFDGTCKLHEDPRLVEQSFGLLGLLNDHHDDPALHRIYNDLVRLSKKHSDQQKFIARTPFGESPQDAYNRVDLFLNSLRRDEMKNIKDHLIISHGATIKAFLMRWFHLPMSAWESLDTPHNCDVFCIETTTDSERQSSRARWKVRKLFDGECGVECNTNPIQHIDRLSVDRLPQLPDFIPHI